ncbi:MAG: hypothetical protein KA339_02305 [Candidatus Kapabacteria bacterium]|nr:hypothetical protein [Candidatus Kapabacteria bacterium]MBP7092723.1 hypothetical protein [Candidatus Kapabacteria bacterium]
MANTIILILVTLLSTLNCTSQMMWTGYQQRSSAVIELDQCRRTMVVLDASIFHRGDKILLHQTTSNDSRFVGLCEYSVVDTVIGSVVYLETSRVHTYDARGGLQAVRILTAKTAMITDTLRTMPWNGMWGGVIALECKDTLIVDGVVNADACGGRGGRVGINTLDTAALMDSININDNRCSGEGPGAARGGWSRNAGGGGGALAGAGGKGGDQTSAYGQLPRGGSGGSSVEDTSSSTRIFIGSGGGSGHQNDFHGTRGGHGGGIILISAPILILGQRSSFTAQGGTAQNAYEDGAGGGGSGGTIILDVDSAVGRSSVVVSGGNGGSTSGVLFHYGPGGGGGGGVSAFRSRRVAMSFTESFVGGAGGTSTCDVLSERIAFGAQAGVDGASTSARSIPTGRRRTQRVAMQARDTLVTEGTSTIITATGGVSYRWIDNVDSVSSNGNSAQTRPIYQPTWCTVEITTEDGCIVVDSILISPRVSALPKLIVQADNAHGAPGDTIDLYVRIRSEPINQRTVNGIVHVSMRATTLIPVRRSMRINDTVISMEFPFTLNARAGTTYRRSSARVALGDSSQIILRIDSVQLDTTTRDLVLEHGRFTLDGLCDEQGRVRLLGPFEPQYSVSGRQIFAEVDEMILTDLLGKTIPHDGVRTGSQLSTSVPEDMHGLIYLTLIKNGRRRTMGIMIE